MHLIIPSLRAVEVGESQSFEVGRATADFEDLPQLQNLGLQGSLTRLEDHVLVEGTLTATVPQTCARCLKEYGHAVETDFAEQFSERPTPEQFGYEHDDLDLAPLARSVILLALPSRPLHDPDCRGLCPVCGKDLNEVPHEHPAEKADHPFAALKDKLGGKDS